MLEGCRLRYTVALYRAVATQQVVNDYNPCVPDPSDPTFLRPMPNPDPQKKSMTLLAGSAIILDLTTASHDPAAYPDPETVRLDRPVGSYFNWGWGPHQCAGMEAYRAILTATFKVVVGLKGLKRADGPRGQLKSLPASVWGGQVGRNPVDGSEWSGTRTYMTVDQSAYTSIPSTMRIRWTV